MKSALITSIILLITLNIFSQGNFISSHQNSQNVSCNNWLLTQNPGQSVKIGDLDISGNKITVEAMINRTQPYFGGYNFGGDIVSKHNDPNDVNYLLRSNNAEITTTNGYFGTPPICEISLNQTYHVALVYDGTTLKFYRNGFLMSQTPATGNLFQNDYSTTIGDWAIYSAPIGTSFKGYINEVRIWNVVKTQSELQLYMNTSLPNPTTQPGLKGYYTFDNLLNKQGNPAFNGTLNGTASINNTNPNCNFTPTNCNSCNLNFDFYYEFNPCSPLTVKFHGTGSDTLNPVWIFDDGTTLSGNLNPSHTYPSTGIYNVYYIVSNGTCSDTLKKSININFVQDNIILTPNTTICSGSSLSLTTKPSLNFCWSPTTFLNNPSSPNPTTNTPQDITYYFTSLESGTNLISNGNFENGNTGFISDYLYNPSSGFNGGVYNVGSSIIAWHSGMANCSDHTTGSGKMLMVNGSNDVGAKVWTQTISVLPNTNYAFSTWLQNISFLNPAKLQFQINGVQIGPIFNANNASCIWEQFYTTWNSGNNTSVSISITNQNLVFSGNDFALDDISFAPVFLKRDSVLIKIDKPVVKTLKDSIICEGSSLNLTTTGAASYGWTPSAGLNNNSIASPTANPINTTQYIVTGTTVNGCSAKDTVLITVKPKPIIKTISDTTFCGAKNIVLNTSGGISYSWSPATNLSNPNIANPVFTGTNAQAYTYYVTGTGANACSAKDTVKLTLNAQPVVSTISNTAICENDVLQLLTNSTAQINTWTPAIAVSNPNSASPFFTATTNQTLIITGTNASGCFAKDTVNVTVKSKPIIKTISDTTFCGAKNIVLNTSGGISYSWSPATNLSNPNIANPVFTGTNAQAYTYYVTGTGANACSAKDTVKITLNAQPVVSTISSTSICENDVLQLLTNSTAQTNSWTPAIAVSNPNSISPFFTATTNQTLIITGTNASGCFAKDTVNVSVKPKPIIKTISDTTFCGAKNIVLNTSGGISYSWSPATNLSNPNIANPVFTGTNAQAYTYYVTGTGANACSAKDTVKITLNAQPVVSTISSTSICENDVLQLLTNSTAQTNTWTPAIAVSNPNSISPFFTATTNQTLIITGTNASGCFAKDTVNVTVKPKPIIKTISDTTFCGAKNIVLNTSGGISYSWSPATNLSNPNIANPVFTGTNAQAYTYYVTGTGANACSAKDTVKLTLNAQPVVSTISNTSICENDVLQLLTNSTAQTNTWTPAIAVSNPNSISPFFTATTNQTLIITGTNASGCFAKDTVNVTVKPKPTVKTISDSVTCSLTSIVLTTSGAQTYNWSPATNLDNPNISNPVFSGTGTSTYIVTGTATNGCIGKDTVKLTISTKPEFNSPSNKSTCRNSSVELNGNNGSDKIYLWSPSTYLSNYNSQNPIANPPMTTVYNLKITDRICGFDSSFTVTVTVNQLPNVRAQKSNDLDCSKYQSQLTASGALSYTWTPAIALSNPNISNPIANPITTTKYIVTGTDGNGCSKRDTVQLNVKGTQNFGFVVPNSFTPNGDNLNDCFGVKFWGRVDNFNFMIFNRWGEKVFETNNINECWDGYYKGKECETGNFVYFITGKSPCGEIVKKGNLVLLK